MSYFDKNLIMIGDFRDWPVDISLLIHNLHGDDAALPAGRRGQAEELQLVERYRHHVLWDVLGGGMLGVSNADLLILI